MKIAITVDENNIVRSVCRCISNKVNYDGILINCDLPSVYGIVDNYKYIDGTLVKRTEEEIQASKEENTTTKKEPNEQEILNAQLLEEIAQQKIVNAQLMQEIATLKGGTTNV